MTEPAYPLWKSALLRCGFHLPVLQFALRTAIAAFVATAIAYALGLEHPHWAAMSAWASSQPMREHLLSRGIYRLGGSVAGVIFAVLLVLLAQDSIWVLALGLCVWGTLCAFFGNLQRGYMVYGCMLAGYSASMVVLLHHGPVETIWGFASDRLLTVLTGVLVALCISWWFSPRRRADVLIARSRQAMAQVLESAVQRLRRQPAAPAGADLLGQLAQVEELLELYPEGSRTAGRTAKAMHWQQHQALELVYQMASDEANLPAPSGRISAEQEALAVALEALCQALRQPPASAPGLEADLRQAIQACETLVEQRQSGQQTVAPGLNALYLLLQEMRRSTRAEQDDLSLGQGRPALPDRRVDPLPLHCDWVGARQAAVRAGGSLLVFGLLWAITGWSLVAFGMLGLSVMLLVFSGFENPRRIMGFVIRGQIIGAVLALLCQWLVWPWAGSGWMMVWMLLPFTLIAGLFFAHPRTAAGGMDTNMAMLILLAPVFPYAVDMGKSTGMALALVAGPVLAWIIYTWIYPTNAVQRMRTLAGMMLAEVPALAQRLLREGQPAWWERFSQGWALDQRDRWTAQLHHRLLRLIRWAEKTGHPSREQLPEMVRALRAMQTTMVQLQRWREATIGATPALRRALRQAELTLRRTMRWTPQSQTEAVQAWLALSTAAGLPTALAEQAARVARRDLPLLQSARQQLL